MKKNNKGLIITLIIIVLLIVILSIVTKDISNNTILITNYVSNLESNDINTKIDACNIKNVLKNNNVPYFKLNNKVYQDINQEILTNFFLRACYQNGEINYDVSLNNKILSLVLNINYNNTDDTNYIEYKTYNINLDNNSLISNENLLKKYNLSIENVENIFISKINEYYEYEKKNDNNISFSNFLQEIDYKKITLDNLNLYIDNDNNLYFYKTYKFTQMMALDENYPEIINKFKLN